MPKAAAAGQEGNKKPTRFFACLKERARSHHQCMIATEANEFEKQVPIKWQFVPFLTPLHS